MKYKEGGFGSLPQGFRRPSRGLGSAGRFGTGFAARGPGFASRGTAHHVHARRAHAEFVAEPLGLHKIRGGIGRAGANFHMGLSQMRCNTHNVTF